MDDRADQRAQRNQIAQLIAVGGLVVFLYYYLANRDTPELTIMELVKGVIKLATLQWDRIPNHFWYVFGDAALFAGIFTLWLAFFVQFALPARTLGQRWRAVAYGLRFSLRQHGPAAKVDDGNVSEGYTIGRPHKPTVLVLDTASAGVLRTRAGFTRSIGPGLTFTRPGEYLAGVVDLHSRNWPRNPLGPLGNENPFAPQGEGESDEQFQLRQNRRFETSEKTRNGVEVAPNISTVAALDNTLPLERGDLPPRETEPRFNYNPEAVRLLVTAEAFASGANIEPENRRIEWYQLPVILATDLWREYVRKFTLEELFTRLPGHDMSTGIQVIQAQVRARLTLASVERLDETGQRTGEMMVSREFQELQRRGIRVFIVNVRNFFIDEAIDQRMEDSWFSAWERRARNEQNWVEQQRGQAQRVGELQALRDFARAAAAPFLTPEWNNPASQPSAAERTIRLRQALERLLQATLRLGATDRQLSLRLVGELRQLAAMIDWLRQ
ncbi:MAG: hypothetical protein L0Z70_08335 [Chloroflexi bacterium]|nr:hypothetical protein [Chloroflexota bacterium]